MSQKIILTGAPRVSGQAGERLELADFVATQNEKQFSLYIQALQRIYERPQSDVVSYFQIGGIHGRPYVDWNQSPSTDRTRGYCVHGTSLFATWHRPYVVLLEQEIQQVALIIANEYTEDRIAWVNAANSLRQPYWGWDTSATLTPPGEVISEPRVTIKLPPQATSTPVSNPFFQYTFPTDTDMASMTPCPFHHHPVQNTTRNPNAQGTSDISEIKSLLQGPIGKQILGLTRDLDSVTTWQGFASALEYVHGMVHDVVGGLGNRRIPSGHMGWVPYAGFDPIFWAHHAQVDRLIQNWYERHKQWESSQADLTPFWSSEITYWRSQNIVDPDATFNYRYPSALLEVMSAAERPRWNAYVSAKKFELRGSYTVFIFLGKVPADSRDWPTDSHFAGIFSVFANSTPEECANCRDQTDLVVEGFVYLDDALKAAGLDSLDEQNVATFLNAEVDSEKVNLNWAVSTADGRILRSEDLSTYFPSLQTLITERIGDKAPIHGGYKPFPDITRGRPGGYRGD